MYACATIVKQKDTVEEPHLQEFPVSRRTGRDNIAV
jgi:hypothetical protein